MKIIVNETAASVAVAASIARPIRLHVGGLRYAMSEAEAIALAHSLADAVASTKGGTR